MAFAFAKTDPLVLELKRKPVARKSQKIAKIAVKKIPKKAAKKDPYNDIFAGVEYGNHKSKS